MAQSTDFTGFCHWHGGPSSTAVLIRTVDRSSAPPVDLYACTPCREQRGLTPLAEQAAQPRLGAEHFG